MPFQRRCTPTIAGVTLQISEFERRYRLESDAFVMHDLRSAHVDEDDGMQWLYLIEQLRVLREAAVGTLYSAGAESGPLENQESSPEQFAA
jgi:hypothetical protein